MKKSILIITSLLVLLVISACTTLPKDDLGNDVVDKDDAGLDKTFCRSDDDCVCGGIDSTTGICFLGNREYYEEYVDKSKECPDFCKGIAGNLAVRCVDNTCIQMYECVSDDECGKGKVCRKNACVVSKTSSAEGEPAHPGCVSDSDCGRMGCSGEICALKSEGPIMSTCEYKEEYNCFELSSCGCVAGECDWDINDDYEECLSDILRR